jgi:RND family efflux transporter MFP subunit
MTSILIGCADHPDVSRAKSPQIPPAEVETVPVSIGQQQQFQEVVGTVQARLRAVIEAKTSGRVVSMPVRLGQKVEKGELLVQLEAAEIQARHDQASANLEQARTDQRRLRALYEQQALTQAEFDAVNTRFRVAEAALRESETQLLYAKITAPFSGVIVRKLADVGDLAAPGKPLLEMEDPTALRFVADIPDSLLRDLAVGTEAEVHLHDKRIPARITEISPAGDPVSRTARVELDLPPGVARSGAFGRVLVPSGDHSMITVPAEALVLRGQLEMVFVASSNRAELRLVKTGRHFEDTIEILSGLSAGETIIAGPASTLRDGQAISTR